MSFTDQPSDQPTVRQRKRSDDHLSSSQTLRKPQRCTSEQIRGARRSCERYVRSKGDSDIGLLHDLIDMLGLGEDADEKLNEDTEKAS